MKLPPTPVYAQTIALDPSHITALEGRARLALYRDDAKVAVESLTALVRLIPVDKLEELADLREQLGKLHLRLGNFAPSSGVSGRCFSARFSAYRYYADPHFCLREARRF